MNWKLFYILLGACLLSTLAVLPYAFTLQADTIKAIPYPLPFIVLASVLQSGILFAIAILIGLALSRKVGFGLPILSGWIDGKRAMKPLKSILWISAKAGVAVGVAILVMDSLFARFGVTFSITSTDPPAWQGLLASFYGGIGEEVLLRLFLMTLLVWISTTIKTTTDGKPTRIGIWIAILLSTILFGLGHLPATAAFTTLTPLVITRAIVLNGIGGIVFGWLYWKKGLESAIIAHFTADLVLHVLAPMLA